ncbi:hypothetical protein BGHDH14_bgh04887 [Blumeria hordei DH14]|uniref:Uncharacterized protein n=1 Tax=Blumeria graminis f. sp. hordei (strain DH14) TaxID=546991 RepID=N1J528_BLUG1|nr:hypothetical protein BGHDH14_bgh04887 [Blumeria hordei DH14]
MNCNFRSESMDTNHSHHFHQDGIDDENSIRGCNSRRTVHGSKNSLESLNQKYRNEDYDFNENEINCNQEQEDEQDENLKNDIFNDREKDSYQALIRDQKHYESLVNNRIISERNEGLKNYADTFPTDPIIQRQWVKKIFDAILNLDGIIDKETKYQNSLSQAARRVRDGYYPIIEIEKTAWKLMLNARDSQLGVRLIEKYHGIKTEEPLLNGVGIFETWADRMQAIINTLRVSKAACKQLMDPHYIDRIVECPNSERQRINTERDIQNQLGRKLLDLKYIPAIDIEKEAKKLQIIKEAHRSITPVKAPRAVEPRQIEYFPTTPTTKASEISHNVPILAISQRKSQMSKIKKSPHNNLPNIEREEQNSKFARSGKKKELDEYTDIQPPTKRSRQNRMCTNPKIFNKTLEENTNVDTEFPSYTGMYVPSLNTELVSTNNNSFMDESSGFNQLNQNSNRFEMGHVITTFELGPEIELFSDNQVMASCFQQDPLNECSHHSPHQASMFEPKFIKLYSEIICNLLEINIENASNCTLEDLRLYAHAYNSKFIACRWSHPNLGANIAKGCYIYDQCNRQIYHFIHFFPSLTGIALARGDIDCNFNAVSGANYSHLFNTRGDKLIDEALGLIENPCGFSPIFSTSVKKMS